MAEVKNEAKYDGKEIFVVYAPFDHALTALRNSGMGYPMRARDLADARIQLGKSSPVSKNGSYTREGFAYAKGEPTLLVLQSPLLRKDMAEQAVQTNRQRKYFSTSDLEVYEQLRSQAEEDTNVAPEKRKVIILPERSDFNVARTSDVAKGLLRDQAEAYFDFINQENVRMYLVDSSTVDAQKGTLLTQLWFYGLDDWSGLGGDRVLGYDCRVRGVNASAEGTAPQNLDVYTQRVRQALNRIGLGGQVEKLVIDALKE